MVLILAFTVRTYNWFVDFNKNPPAPRESTEPPVSDPAPVIWPEVARDLGGAKSLTVYSLSPRGGPGEAWAPEKPSFHEYLILGSARVTSPKKIARIVTNVAQGVSFQDSWPMCFLPRHGVQATLGDGRQIDLVICYQCERIDVYGARQHLQVHPGRSKETLDDVLRSAGVDLKDPRLDLDLLGGSPKG
jgi:hypothetical protein